MELLALPDAGVLPVIGAFRGVWGGGVRGRPEQQGAGEKMKPRKWFFGM